jgi:hypothetical protein
MSQLEVGQLSVSDELCVVSMIIDRDSTVWATAKEGGPNMTPVHKVVSPEIIDGLADQNVEMAVQ